MKKTIPVMLCVLLSACTWVELSEEGRKVAVLDREDIGNCQRVADTTVTVRDRVLLSRSRDKVRVELESLARNAAAERGGDAVVPSSPVREGRRSYDIYRCR